MADEGCPEQDIEYSKVAESDSVMDWNGRSQKCEAADSEVAVFVSKRSIDIPTDGSTS